MALDDDSWRDTYDEWKLRSPYDEEPWEEEREECDHSEYEIDWEGRAECHQCSETWWPSPEVVKAYDEAQRRYEREMRRYHSWYMHAWRWLKARMPRLPQRRAPAPIIDDDIPF